MVLNLFLGALAAVVLAIPLAVAEESVPDDNAVDLLTLAEGAIIVSASANAPAAQSLTDGAPATAWHNEGKRDPLPYSFVFELRSPTVLRQVGVVGGGSRPGGAVGASVNDVRIEASTEGPDTGFGEIAAFSAAKDGETIADVDLTSPVRWLRFNIDSNYGNEFWTYFNEAIAFGTQEEANSPVDFNGVFQTGRADFLELKQEGTSLTGCYTQQSGHTLGTLRGDVENGVARLIWKTDKGIDGTALLALDGRGRLTGVQYRQKSRSIWEGAPAAEGAVTQCSDVPPPANPVLAALGESCRVPLYGVLFDFDKATLKPASFPTLENVLEAMQQEPALNLTIEGHTDSDGTDAYNLDLSDARAASVVEWLVTHQVDPDRLLSAGRGETEPVASNDTADGRALNRRVELVKC